MTILQTPSTRAPISPNLLRPGLTLLVGDSAFCERPIITTAVMIHHGVPPLKASKRVFVATDCEYMTHARIDATEERLGLPPSKMHNRLWSCAFYNPFTEGDFFREMARRTNSDYVFLTQPLPKDREGQAAAFAMLKRLSAEAPWAAIVAHTRRIQLTVPELGATRVSRRGSR